MKRFRHKKRAQEIINVNYRLCFGLAKKNIRDKIHQCKATIKLLVSDEFIAQNNEHAHPLSQTEVEATKTKASIKQKAEATEEISQQILASEVRNIPLQISILSVLSRRPPSFALDLSNMFNRTDGELPRTNLSTNVIIMSDCEKSDLCSNLSVSVFIKSSYEISSTFNDLCIIRRGVISKKAMLLLWYFYQCLCFLHI